MAAAILVVDDSPTQLRRAVRLLESEGHRVVTAIDGEQALVVAAQERPVLVVLDIILPKKNGFQVCRELKSMAGHQNVKIVMLSSKSQNNDRLWGLEQGADRYLTKPYEHEDLIGAVAELLEEAASTAAALRGAAG